MNKMLIEKKIINKYMFDLNGKDFQGSTIFNSGIAGLVRNVDISIEKKQGEGNTPDYKLIAKDANGTINQGFYYILPNPQKNDEDNAKYAKQQISRVLHIARAVLGADYEFPAVSTPREAYDVLFKLISENCAGKKFNIFTTYGTVNRPSKYLGFRYFNFIESAREVTSLKTGNVDLLSRPEQDKNESTDDGLDLLSSKPLEEDLKL